MSFILNTKYLEFGPKTATLEEGWAYSADFTEHGSDVQHNGRTYTVIGQIQKNLSKLERFGWGLLATVAIVATLGLAAISQTIRNLYHVKIQKTRLAVAAENITQNEIKGEKSVEALKRFLKIDKGTPAYFKRLDILTEEQFKLIFPELFLHIDSINKILLPQLDLSKLSDAQITYFFLDPKRNLGFLTTEQLQPFLTKIPVPNLTTHVPIKKLQKLDFSTMGAAYFAPKPRPGINGHFENLFKNLTKAQLESIDSLIGPQLRETFTRVLANKSDSNLASGSPVEESSPDNR